MITLKQVEALYWAAELGSFELASVRLRTTQSAISKRLQELELALGVQLFDRSRRTARLTPKGEELLSLAQDMLLLRNRMVGSAAGSTSATRRLRLGVTDLTAMTWLPSLIRKIRARHPAVVLEPEVDTSTRLIERLSEKKLDVVIAPDAFNDPRFETVPLGRVEYAWMCSPDYLDDVPELKLSDLAKYTVIIQTNASGLGKIINKWLVSNDISIETPIFSSNLSALASLTLSGLGISYLPRLSFDYLVASGQLRIIRIRPSLPRVSYVAVFDRSQADDFFEFLTDAAIETCDFSRILQGFGARTDWRGP